MLAHRFARRQSGPNCCALLMCRRERECQGRGEPPPFLQVLILRDFKSNDFASADSRRVTDAFCVSAESKAVMGASMADPQQPESMRSAKHLAGFAGQGTSPVTSIQIENRRFAHFLHACSSNTSRSALSLRTSNCSWVIAVSSC